MSNLGLYKAFDKEGIKYEKTAVGDKYVNENMVKNGHVLGGEQSLKNVNKIVDKMIEKGFVIKR